MSELRAPDPTLTALIHQDADHRVLCQDDTSVTGGMIAHRPGGPLSSYSPVDRMSLTGCGLSTTGPGFAVRQARHVRWHALPCREPGCFPHASPPGHVWSTYVMGRQADVDEYSHAVPELRWQLTEVPA